MEAASFDDVKKVMETDFERTLETRQIIYDQTIETRQMIFRLLMILVRQKIVTWEEVKEIMDTPEEEE